MAVLSELQVEVMTHVAERQGLPYDADPGSPDDLAWSSLVDLGLATGPRRGWGFPGNFYYLTDAGRAMAELAIAARGAEAPRC